MLLSALLIILKIFGIICISVAAAFLVFIFSIIVLLIIVAIKMCWITAKES